MTRATNARIAGFTFLAYNRVAEGVIAGLSIPVTLTLSCSSGAG
jgi:hypothetical protein